MKFGKVVEVKKDFVTAAGTSFKKGEKATLVRKNQRCWPNILGFKTDDGRDFNLIPQVQDEYICPFVEAQKKAVKKLKDDAANNDKCPECQGLLVAVPKHGYLDCEECGNR